MTLAPMFLTREEIAALTARVQYAAQKKVLSMMGIEHRTRPDGSIVILRTHVEQLFGGISTSRTIKPAEPNWGALNASRT